MEVSKVIVKPQDNAYQPFMNSMTRIQNHVSPFFDDITEEFVKQSIWSFKWRMVHSALEKAKNNSKSVVESRTHAKENNATRNFFKRWSQKLPNFKKQHCMIDKRKDVNQQNMYSNYIPVDRNLLPGDFLLEQFPIIERIDLEDVFTELRFVDDSTEQQRLCNWFSLQKAMKLNLDIEQKIWVWYVMHAHKRKLTTTAFLNGFFDQHTTKQQNFSLVDEQVKLLIRHQELLTLNNQRSNQFAAGEEEDQSAEKKQLAITENYKFYFCNRCYIYDCRVHYVENSKKGLDFMSPSTQAVQYSTNQQKSAVKFLVDYYNECVKSSATQKSGNIQPHKKQCGSTCYLNMTFEKAKKLRKELETKKSQWMQSNLVEVGCLRFRYNPCEVSLVLADCTCELAFLYLIREQVNFNQMDVERYSQQVKQNQLGSKNAKPTKRQQSKTSKMPIAEMSSSDSVEEKEFDSEDDEGQNAASHSQISTMNGQTVGGGGNGQDSNNSGDSAKPLNQGFPCVHMRLGSRQKLRQDCRNCQCSVRGFCDSYCLCDPAKCKIQRIGCDCRDTCKTVKCPCFKNNLECDPELCRSCYRCKDEIVLCRNNEITLKKSQRLVIANSEVCGGMGIFNVYPIRKGDLVIVYVGEILSDMDIVIRDSWKPSDLFYIFSLQDDLTVDSKYVGNKSRFMNHSKNKDNCTAKMMYVRGCFEIGLYAKTDIPPGSELLFDYDGDDTLKHKYEWISKNVDSKRKSNQIKIENEINYDAGFSERNTHSRHLKTPSRRKQDNPLVNGRSSSSNLRGNNNSFDFGNRGTAKR